jgi:hypothetical protein
MRTPRRTLVSVMTAVVLAGATACAGDDPTPVQAAPEVSEEVTTGPVTEQRGEPTPSQSAPGESAPSESAQSESAPSGPPAGDTGGYSAKQLLRAMKVAVSKNRSSHFTMSMTGGVQEMTAEGDVDYTDRGPKLRMTMAAPALGGQEIEMRVVDGVVYMAVPQMTPKGKFLAIDTSDPRSPYGAMGGLDQMDPLSTFDAFDAGLRKVRYVGEDNVAGEVMDHYVLTVGMAAAFRARGQEPTPGMPRRLAYDLWLDNRDLMRKVSFDVNGLVAMDMTMSDWGKRVRVAAPPADRVVEDLQR